METTKLPLVSILSPCHNGETYIHRFLDSVLGQTYSKLQLILVDDGSTDHTKDVIFSYKEEFADKNIEFIYIYQDNAGQAAAINKGLQYVTGEYFCWPDSDDFFSKDSIQKKVELLESNEEYDFVVCNSNFVNDDLEIVGSLKRPIDDNNDLFKDIIYENNAVFSGGAYLVRFDFLKSVLLNGEIFETRAGQNIQLILPIAYSGKYIHLTDYLFNIYVREGSHSRQANTYNSEVAKANGHEELFCHVISNIKNMSDEEKENYLKILKIKYLRKNLSIAVKYRMKQPVINYFSQMKQLNVTKLKDYILYVEGTSFLGNKIVKCYRILHSLVVK